MKISTGLIGASLILIAGFTVCTQVEEAPIPDLSFTDYGLRLSVGDRAVLSYITEPTLPATNGVDSLAAHYLRSGFIHPVVSPRGTVVTDDFPVGHTHQHGIFTAWTKVRFRGNELDFWNQQKGLGTVVHDSLLSVIDTDKVAGFNSRLYQVSTAYGPILREEWHVRLYPETGPYVWDLRSEQTNITEDTLYLEQHLYGGLGVRGSAAWNGVDSLRFRGRARFLTSAGAEGDAANHTRPEWVAIFGETSDTAGIAVLPAPENFRAPQFVRVHPEMPYLSVTPVVDSGFKIAPGQSYTSAYRFVVFDGSPHRIDFSAYAWDAFPGR